MAVVLPSTEPQVRDRAVVTVEDANASFSSWSHGGKSKKQGTRQRSTFGSAATAQRQAPSAAVARAERYQAQRPPAPAAGSALAGSDAGTSRVSGPPKVDRSRPSDSKDAEEEKKQDNVTSTDRWNEQGSPSRQVSPPVPVLYVDARVPQCA